MRKFVSVSKTFSEADARIIGPALQKIANDNKVDDISSLDKELVFRTVEADPKHPLRRFYNWDDAACARKHRLERTHRMLSAIRIVTVNLGKRSRPVPQFLFVPEDDKEKVGKGKKGMKRRRRHVLTSDVLENDPMFTSALSSKIRAIEELTRSLAHTASLNKATPREVKLLVAGLVGALDKYMVSVSKARAAA